MTDGRPRIWFERPVLAELVSEVEAACTVLGPGTDDDPYAGVEIAVAALAGGAPYDASFFDRAPALRVLARTGIGYDGVDVDAATLRGVVVCNTPDGPTVSTAEHAVTLMLMVAKRMPAAQDASRTGVIGGYYGRHVGIELDGKRLGLVGFGRIARRVARIAEGIGMLVTVFDPYIDDATVPGSVQRSQSLGELLRDADVVSVHVPLTDGSRGMFGAPQFAAMQPGAIFINTARGGLVDHDALLASLESGHLFGAGLDVTSPEPLPAGHPLLGRDDVVVTPHVASATADGKLRIFRAAFEGAMDVLEGRRPQHLVNPEVWDRLASATYEGAGR